VLGFVLTGQNDNGGQHGIELGLRAHCCAQTASAGAVLPKTTNAHCAALRPAVRLITSGVECWLVAVWPTLPFSWRRLRLWAGFSPVSL